MASSVSVNVTANTSQAQSAINQLKSQLQSLSSQPININDSKLVEANKTAMELQKNLNAAMNPSTGKFDLAAFNNQLTKTGSSIEKIYTGLSGYGDAGNKAFLSLAKAISQAEAPTTRLNKSLVQFGETLKRTISWQLSSSMIHGVMGAFSKALSYTQQLNESLTNIRIVTGQSIDDMAKFAKEANNSAKALGTTTTAYTNASLIYYQQGLSDKEVKARTDVTMKLANAAGISAEKASSQLTAIWNNFAQGSTNLEHYADVLVKLGSETASSSEEISKGMQKFAAAGKTVGLSYEYGAAALATVTATTRESADTVGTAFRTLFSRLEGLKLGETLEDGTDVNKYSKALQTVGIKIKDASGEMRSMDNILMDLGERWKTLTKDQQIALAQTVGGARQYTTLMALMDNFDTFKRNVNRSNNADGTLQAQQDIYAEGWEAASKRVRASMEDVFDSLIDDQAMIKVTNAFGKILDIVADVTDGFGGLGGVLTGVAGIFMQHYAKEMPTVLTDIGLGLQSIFRPKKYQEAIGEKIKEVNPYLESLRAKSTSRADQAEIAGIEQQLRMNRAYQLKSASMSAQERANYEMAMQVAQLSANQRQQQGQKIDALAEDIIEEKKAAELDIDTGIKNRAVTAEQNRQAQKIADQRRQQEKDNGTWNEHKENRYNDQKEQRAVENLGIFEQQKNSKEAMRELFILQNGTTDGFIEYANTTQGRANWKKQTDTMVASYGDLVSKNAKQQKLGERLDVVDSNFSSMSPDKIRQFFTEFKNQAKALQMEFKDDKGNSLLDQIIGDPSASDIQEKINTVKEKIKEATAESGAQVDQQKEQLEKAGATGVEEFTEVTSEQASQEVDFDFDAPNAENDELPEHKGGSPSEKFTAVAGAVTSTVAAVSQLSGAIDNFAENGFNFDTAITGLTSLASAATMVSMAAQSIGTAFGVAAGPIGWIIAAVGALAIGAKHLYDLYDRTHENEEERQERIKNDYTQANQAAEKAKNSYEELNTTMASYEDALEGLSKLTKGTTEYAVALNGANEQAEKLIKSGDLVLGKDYSIDKNGVKQVSVSSQMALQQDADKARQNALLDEAVSEFVQNDTDRTIAYAENLDDTVTLLNNIGTFANNFFGSKYNSSSWMNANQYTKQGKKMAELFDKEGMIDKVNNYLEAWDEIESTNNLDEKRGKIEDLIESGYGSELISIFYQAGTRTGNFDGFEPTEGWTETYGSFWTDFNSIYTDSMLNMLTQTSGELQQYMHDNVQISDEAKQAANSLMLEYAAQDGNITLLEKAAANAVAQNDYNAEMASQIDEESKTIKIGDNDINLTLEDDLKKVTLDQLRKAFLGLEGVSKYQLNEIINDPEFAAATEQGRKQLLADAIRRQQRTKAFTDKFDSQLEAIQDDPFYNQFGEKFYQTGILDILKIVNSTNYNSPILDMMQQEWVNASSDLYGLINQSTGLMSSGLFGNGSAYDFAGIMTLKNMSVETLEAIGQAGSNLLTTFGDKTFSDFITDIFNVEGKNYDIDLLDAIESLDFSDTLTGLFSLKKAQKKTLNKELQSQLSDLYNSALTDLGGQGGLLNELFGAESFQSVLESLNNEFKTTGKITAEAIAKAAKNCDILNDYLKEGEHTAGELAKAMTMINEEELNPATLSDAFFESLKAAEEGAQLLQNSFDFIDGFTMPRSFKDVADFYGKFEKIIQTAQAAGLIDDPTIRAGFNGAFGTTKTFGDNTVYQEYARMMAQWQDAGLSAGEIQSNYQSYFADEIRLMQALADGKGIQSYFDYYNKKGILKDSGIIYNDSDGTTSGEGYVTDKETGERRLAATEQELIDALVLQGIDENIATAMANNMRYGNASLNQRWSKAEASQALDVYEANLSKDTIVTQDELKALHNQYGDFWKEQYKDFKAFMKAMSEKTGAVLKTTADSFNNLSNFENMLSDSSIDGGLSGYLNKMNGQLDRSKSLVTTTMSDEDQSTIWTTFKENKNIFDYDKSIQALEAAGATSAQAMAILQESGETFAKTWIDAAGNTHTEIQNANQTLEDFNAEVDRRIADDQINHTAQIMKQAFKDLGGIPLDIQFDEDGKLSERLTQFFSQLSQSHSINIDTSEAEAKITALQAKLDELNGGSVKPDNTYAAAKEDQLIQEQMRREAEQVESRNNATALQMWGAATQTAQNGGDSDAILAAIVNAGNLNLGDMVSRVLSQGDFGDTSELTLELGNGTRITLNTDGQILTSLIDSSPELETYGTTDNKAAETYTASEFNFDPGNITGEQFGVAFAEKVINSKNFEALGSEHASDAAYLYDQMAAAQMENSTVLNNVGNVMQSLMEAGVFSAREDGTYQFPDGTVITAEGIEIASTQGTEMSGADFKAKFDTEGLPEELANIGDDATVTVKVNAETGDFTASIQDAANNTSITAKVNYIKGTQEGASDVTATVNYVKGSQEGPSGATGGLVKARAEGGSINHPLEGGLTFTGEEGPEIIWNKEHGYAYVTGKKRPEFAYLRPGDRVFNAAETKAILSGSGNVQREYTGIAYSGGVVPAKATTSNPIFDFKDKKDVIRGAIADGNGEDKWKPERYHYINNLIKDLEREFDLLNKIKDRTFGLQHINAINAETAALEQQMDTNKAYMEEIKNWEQYDIQKLKDLGVYDEIVFDENGFIANYQELDEKYGKLAANKDENAKKVIEALKQLEETREKLKDAIDKQLDLAIQYLDNRLESIKAEIELKVDISADNLNLLDTLLKRSKDDAYEAAYNIGLMGQQMDEYMTQLDANKTGLAKIIGEHIDLGENPEESMQGIISNIKNMSAEEAEKYLINAGFSSNDIEEIRKLLKEDESLLDKISTKEKEIFDQVSKTFSQYTSDIKTQLQLFTHYNTVLGTMKEISNLMSTSLGPQTKELISTMNKGMFDNAKNNATAAKNHLDNMLNQQKKANAELAKAQESGNADYIKRYQDIKDQVDKEVNQAQEDYLTAWQNSLQIAGQILQEESENAAEAFEKSITSFYGSLESFREAYDRMSEVEEDYLADYDKLYELSKLNRDISKSIDDTDNINSKKKLISLQEEINKLQAEGVKLSEHDVDVLRKRYELEIARQELEDSKNSKSMVTLSRDQNGNWGYVYTADDDKVAKAEQDYEDKLHALQESNDKYIKDLQGKLINLQSSSEEAINKVVGNFQSGKITESEANKQIRDILDYYETQTGYFTSELEKVFGDQKATYELMKELYGVDSAELMDTLSETVLGSLPGYDGNDISGIYNNLIAQFTTFANKQKENMSDYAESVEEANEAAGAKNPAEALSQIVADVGTASTDTMEKVKTLGEELDTAFTDAYKAVDTFLNAFEEKYHTTIQGAFDDTVDFITIFNDMIATLSNINATADPDLVSAGIIHAAARSAYKDAKAKHKSGAMSDKDWKKAQEDWDKAEKEWKLAQMKYYDPDAYAQYLADTKPAETKSNTKPSIPDNLPVSLRGYKISGYDDRGFPLKEQVVSWSEYQRYLKRKDLSVKATPVYYDTGGYTGEWGNSGKLAVLHEKELVLNKNDTRNLLDTIGMLKALEVNASTYQNTLTDLISQNNYRIYKDFQSSGAQQFITISAEFPNATDRNEIQEAFNNLINEAAQYANRK